MSNVQFDPINLDELRGAMAYFEKKTWNFRSFIKQSRTQASEIPEMRYYQGGFEHNWNSKTAGTIISAKATCKLVLNSDEIMLLQGKC